MRGTALLLAAHGSRDDPRVNARIHDHAARLAAMNSFDEVVAAFHQGQPTFATVLDSIVADRVVVVPVMTSRGYYSETVVPRELARNRRHAVIRIHQTEPLGAHAAIPRLISERLRRLMQEHNLDPGSTSVAVIGHGTTRHEDSRSATIALTATLQESALCLEVIPGFLEEEPLLDSILERARCPAVIVVPFLIAEGWHATRDIPAGLGLDVPEEQGSPICATVRGRTILCDMAVGSYPEIGEILASIAKTGLQLITDN